MKKFALLSLLMLSLSSSVFAALPPFAQTKREMIAILNSNDLATYFNSADAITSIKRSSENSYTVSSKNKEVVVDVIYQNVERKIGPIDFELVFHPVNLP